MADSFMQTIAPLMERKLPLSVWVPVALGAGALLGLFALYFFGWMYRWVGSWFGGVASQGEIRAAIAWSQVPTLWLFALWVAVFLISAGESIRIEGRQGVGSPLAVLFGIALIAASLVISVWKFVILVMTVAEAHRFSTRKGLGTVILPNVLFLLLVFVMGMLAAIAIPNLIRARAHAYESTAIGHMRASQEQIADAASPPLE